MLGSSRSHLYQEENVFKISKLIIVKYLTDINAFVLYTILAIIFTYPVAFSPNKIPGGGDAYWYLWDFWWFKTALFDFATPYYTNYIFHPTGVSLASSEITPLNAVASIPFQVVFGLVGAYKIMWILSFILSGYGAFLLVKYLVKDSRAAFVSGLIFMFCPYHFAHALGHMNLISIQWIPLYILFLIRAVSEKNRSNAFYAAFFLFLNAISSYYYLVYLLLFTAIYLLYVWWYQEGVLDLGAIKNVGVMTASFAAAFSPFMYPIIRELMSSEYMYHGGFVEYSADLLGFFIPTVFHPVFKDYVAPIYANFTSNYAENTVFVGYTVILLSLLALIKIKTLEIRFWAASTFIFFVLSLGPILHINGIFEIPLEGPYCTYIPLPYSILMQIPVFSLARAPSRWTVLLMLSLAVLAGYGLKYLFNRCKARELENNIKTNILFVLISCLVLFEFMAIPYPMSSADAPEFYNTIATDSDDYAIIEIPNISGLVADARYMYYQSIHQKKLVGGYVSRAPVYATNFLDSTPIISNLMKLSQPCEDILKQNYSDAGRSILNYYDVRYIILHTDSMSPEQLELASRIIQMTIDDDPQLYPSDSMIVYEVKKEPLTTFANLKDGWHALGDWDGITTRWMENDATLMIHCDENRVVDLSFKALSFYHPRSIDIYVNDLLQIQAEVPSDRFVITWVPGVSLKEGANIVRFHVPEGCERPADIKELNNPDSRCLSLEVQDIKIARDILINDLESSSTYLAGGWHGL